MFLLDTVVLSDLHKPPWQRNRNLIRWIGEVPSQDLFVSVLTVSEFERGIERQQQLIRTSRASPSFKANAERHILSYACVP